MKRVYSAILISSLLFSCSEREEPSIPPTPEQEMQSTVQNITQSIEKLRQLSFKRPITPFNVSVNFVEELIASEIGTTKAQDEFLNREYYQLGFSKHEDFDFFSHVGGIDASSILGLYIWDNDAIYLVDYFEKLSSDNVADLHNTIAHELTHALQDQHFNLSDMPTSQIHNSYNQTDFQNARLHFIEGDAEFSGDLYELFAANDKNPLETNLYQAEYYRSYFLNLAEVTPLYSQYYENLYPAYSFDSPYMNGPGHTAHLYEKNGNWSAVNSSINEATVTMAEIITDSETPKLRYFPHRELWNLLGKDPDPFFRETTLPTEWYDDDNMGVLSIYSLFGDKIDLDGSKSALGWQGDHLLYHTAHPDEMGQLIWAFSFDSDQRAQKFHGYCKSHILSRFQDKGAPQEDAEMLITEHKIPATRIVHSTVETYLIQSNNEVYWLDNVGEQRDALVTLLYETQESGKLRSAFRSRPEGAFSRKKVIRKPY